MFELHPQLAADTIEAGRLELCRLLLMNDSRYPWCILVPQKDALTEIHQLSEPERQLLMNESCRLAEAMEQLFQPDKLNIAALGNIVSQLHVHHVARYRKDAAWPAPVWGRGTAEPYSPDAAQRRIAQLRVTLQIDP